MCAHHETIPLLLGVVCAYGVSARTMRTALDLGTSVGRAAVCSSPASVAGAPSIDAVDVVFFIFNAIYERFHTLGSSSTSRLLAALVWSSAPKPPGERRRVGTPSEPTGIGGTHAALGGDALAAGVAVLPDEILHAKAHHPAFPSECASDHLSDLLERSFHRRQAWTLVRYSAPLAVTTRMPNRSVGGASQGPMTACPAGSKRPSGKVPGDATAQR